MQINTAQVRSLQPRFPQVGSIHANGILALARHAGAPEIRSERNNSL
jgi:hypothetical protein